MREGGRFVARQENFNNWISIILQKSSAKQRQFLKKTKPYMTADVGKATKQSGHKIIST